MYGQIMDLTKGSCKVHAWRKEGGERRAPNKAGPMRPPLLNGKIWECIGTLGIYYGLDQWLILGGGVGSGFLMEQVKNTHYSK